MSDPWLTPDGFNCWNAQFSDQWNDPCNWSGLCVPDGRGTNILLGDCPDWVENPIGTIEMGKDRECHNLWVSGKYPVTLIGGSLKIGNELIVQDGGSLTVASIKCGSLAYPVPPYSVPEPPGMLDVVVCGAMFTLLAIVLFCKRKHL